MAINLKLNLSRKQKVIIGSGLTFELVAVVYFVWNYAPMVEFYSAEWKAIALFLVFVLAVAAAVFMAFADNQALITTGEYNHRNAHLAHKGVATTLEPLEPTVIHLDMAFADNDAAPETILQAAE